MQLLNIYEYIDHIDKAKQEDLPYPKSDMIYIYSKFLHLEITVDMVLIDNIFTNLKFETRLLSEKSKLTSELLCAPIDSSRTYTILFREFKNGVIDKQWQVNGYYMKIVDLVDTSIEINEDYYNDFCKQVMRKKTK